MFAWTLLTACADPCPTFEQTRVLDAGSLASEAQEEAVAAGIADMATWTGREAVCVEHIAFVDSILGAPELIGHYDGRNIVVEPETSGLKLLTQHELCHALDWHEGLSPSAAHLFRASSGEWWMNEAYRAREVFAELCQGGPGAIPLRAALIESCDIDSRTERERFFADVVWTGAVASHAVEGSAARGSGWTWPFPGRELRAVSADMRDGGYAIGVEASEKGGARRVFVQRLDLSSGARGERWYPDLVPAEYVYARMAADADDTLAAFFTSAGETRGFRIVDTGLVEASLPGASWVGGLALTDGVVFYGATADTGSTVLAAARLDGTPTEPPDLGALGEEVYVVDAVGSSLLIRTDTLHLVDLGDASSVPIEPPDAWALSDPRLLDEERVIFTATGYGSSQPLYGYVVHDTVSGAWSVVGDSCAFEPVPPLMRTGTGWWQVTTLIHEDGYEELKMWPVEGLP